jgi:hypothetical protein
MELLIEGIDSGDESLTNRQRCGAMWQASAPVRDAGPLLNDAINETVVSPLAPMIPQQRTYANFR